jgi:hypothetical protein
VLDFGQGRLERREVGVDVVEGCGPLDHGWLAAESVSGSLRELLGREVAGGLPVQPLEVGWSRSGRAA